MRLCNACRALSILLPFLFAFVPFLYPVLNNNLYYSLPASGTAAVFIFLSFPDAANFFFRKSYNYDHLIDSSSDKERLQRLFTRINMVYSSVLVVFMVFYCTQKYRWSKLLESLDMTHGLSTEVIETVGIASSIFHMFKKLQLTFGKFLISILHRYRGTAAQ